MLISVFLLLSIAIICYTHCSYTIDIEPYTTNSATNTNVITQFNDFDKIYPKIPKESKKIPRILYRTGPLSFNEMPSEFREVVMVNISDYTCVYFDDNECERFVEKKCPHYLKAYRSLIPGAYKADLFRLLIIHEYGGVYNDISHKYLIPIDDVVSEDDEFIIPVDWEGTGRGGYLYNAFMAAYPQHPLIKYMIDDIIININNRYYGRNVLDITGPHAVGKSFNMFFGFEKDSLIPQGRYVLNGFKITMYYNYYVGSYEGESYIVQYKNKPNTHNNLPMIQTKLPGYYQIMYKNPSERYPVLWYERRVYKD